jgi:hypothetical protein
LRQSNGAVNPRILSRKIRKTPRASARGSSELAWATSLSQTSLRAILLVDDRANQLVNENAKLRKPPAAESSDTKV